MCKYADVQIYKCFNQIIWLPFNKIRTFAQIENIKSPLPGEI